MEIPLGKSRPRAECANGHRYTTENVYMTPQGHRRCQTCRNDQQRGYSDRKRSQPPLSAVDLQRLYTKAYSRILANSIESSSGCWVWQGSLIRGYGQIGVGGRTTLVHQVAYWVCVGAIPPGLELDHVKTRGCVSRACVNPAHLEAVSKVENMRRGDCPSSVNARKTHCIRGHPLSGVHLLVVPSTGKRRCITCVNLLKEQRRSSR